MSRFQFRPVQLALDADGDRAVGYMRQQFEAAWVRDILPFLQVGRAGTNSVGRLFSAQAREPNSSSYKKG